jgi:predicted glycogen debranching enzyme
MGGRLVVLRKKAGFAGGLPSALDGPRLGAVGELHREKAMPMIRVAKEVLRDLPAALELEWLETNGLGGYASSTVALANTRAYHGLLVAALAQPPGRYVLLSRLEEVVHHAGQTYFLSTNHYAGGKVVHPEGYLYLEGFTKSLFPTFTYRLGALELGREIFLLHGQNTVVIVYTVKNLPPGQELRLEVRPLVAYRHFHGRSVKNAQLYVPIEAEPGRVRISPYFGLPPLELYHNAQSVEATGSWYDNFHHVREAERGLPPREDLFNHCKLEYSFRESGEAHLIATIEPAEGFPSVGALRRAEVARREALGITEFDALFQRELQLAVSQFVVRRGDGHAVIAGYPWHADRGRDAMIAVPGLASSPAHAAEARSILDTALSRLRLGLLLSQIVDETGEAEYTSFDASLWLFEALWQYVHRTGDKDFAAARAYDLLAGIIDHFIKGTRHGIRMDPQDFLLAGAAPGLQLTWMDAKVGQEIVTQRPGKPVEVQALWYNALRVMERLNEELGLGRADTSSYAHLAQNVRRSFHSRFWSAEKEYLADCILPDGTPDWSVRPNQVFALSLAFPVLERAQQAKVLQKLQSELWTPYGLRTLSPADPRYVGRYEGSVAQRDRALHQGTVWSWLLGPYYNAFFRTHGGRRKETIEEVERQLDPMRQHILEAGLGCVSELFDGDAPHRPRGAISHAAAVAELLRLVHLYLAPRSVRWSGE